MHDFQGQVHGQQCQVCRQRSKNGFSISFIDPARNKLKNYLKIKIRKILKDRQKWRRNCSTNTLKRKISRSHTTKRSPSVEIFLCFYVDRCDNAFVVIFFKTIYKKAIIRFGFCDIRNNQGLSKCYQPQPFGFG